MDAKQIFKIVKTVFLTGASSGIGLAIAKSLVEHEHEVWGTSRNLERIPKMSRLHPVCLDLADRLSIEQAFASTLAEAGHLDVLINNAGAGHFGPAELLPLEVITSQFQILVFGQIQLMQLALQHMRPRGEGSADWIRLRICRATKSGPGAFFMFRSTTSQVLAIFAS